MVLVSNIQPCVKRTALFSIYLTVSSLLLTLICIAYSSYGGIQLGNVEADTASAGMSSWSVPELMDFPRSSQMTNRWACKVFYEFGGVVLNDASRYKDGQKSVCLDEGLKPTINDCLVYSFDIDNEWSFDDDMAKSMEDDDHDRGTNVHFYRMGIWNRDGYIFRHQKRPGVAWKVLTLSSFYNNLKSFHGERIIDYVKIDIQGDEWNILPQIIQSGIVDRIKQLAMEIHFFGNDRMGDIRQRIAVLRSLEHDHGMIPFDYKSNLNSKGFVPAAPDNYACAEIVYFNSKFKI